MAEQDTVAGADTLVQDAEQMIAGGVTQDSQATTTEAVVQDSQSVTVADDAEADDVDTLKQKLADREKRLAQREKDYKELQSSRDRQFNQMQDKFSKMEGKLEALMSKPSTPQREEDIQHLRQQEAALLEKWEAEVEEHPKKALHYADARAEQLRREHKAEMDALRAEFSGLIRKQDPVYQKEKETIDLLVQSGFSEDDAVKAAKVMGSKKQVHQPGSPGAPGRTTDGGRAVTTAPSYRAVELDSATAEAMRLAGLSDKEINAIRLNVGKDLA